MSDLQPDRPWEEDGAAQAKAAENRRMDRTVWLVLLGVAVFVAGCSVLVNRGDDPAPDDAGVSKYTQTWGQSYSNTTCAQWNGQMTSAQRFAAAADMLTGARNKGDGGTGLPTDELIRRFQGDVTEGCSVSTAQTMSVAETGAAIYLIGRSQYQP